MTRETIVTPSDIETARERISSIVHETPLDRSTTFAEMSGAASVGLKLENMQRTGSFKIRGAYNMMSQLAQVERDKGVIASSAGNHAQGVALAGQELDIDTTIVVPEVTPAAKIRATRGYGASVVVEGSIYEESYQYAMDVADREDRTFVHPFNDERIIAGQGTVGLELTEQFPDVDTVFVAIGGGGLISGVSVALLDHDPDVRVIGVQPEGAAHAKPSLDANEIHELETVDTIAEGIADTRLLEKTFTVIRDTVDTVVSVPDHELAVAVSLLTERAKTVAEAAGAAPLAALLHDTTDVHAENVAVVVSGGNVNLTEHGELAKTGLMHQDRCRRVRLALDDWAASLGTVADLVEGEGAELVDIERRSRTPTDHPNRCPVVLTIEGSGSDHLDTVLDALREHENVTVDTNHLH
jgi:threonine dehydratase